MKHLHCPGKNKIHMHIQAIIYRLCHFGDYIYKLNALIFAIKTVILPYKDK